MISNVYSYYLSQYAAKPATKHDSHKKSELRSVYNKMVDINRTSPLYKLNLSDDMQKLAIDIKESAMDLNDISLDLSEAIVNSDGAKKKATSSDETKVDVTYVGDNEALVDEFEVEVKQLAGNQVNTGHYLQPKSQGLAPGTYGFDLSVGDVTYELQFNVDSNENTSDIQDKLTRLINKSGIGVTAGTQTDALGNKAITLTSDATGIRNMKPLLFEITDEDTTVKNGAVDYLGLDRVVEYPANAIFSINGDERTSANNKFTINKAFELELKDVTKEPVTITVEEDSEYYVKEVSDFIDGYNKVVNFAKEAASKYEGGSKLLSEFGRISRAYAEELSESGFVVRDDGSIEFGEDGKKRLGEASQFTKAIETLEKFKASVGRRTTKMTENPMEYVDKKVVAYKNPAKSFASPYSSSVYAGIMYDGYC